MNFVNSFILSCIHVYTWFQFVYAYNKIRPVPSMFTTPCYTNDILRKAQQKFPQTLSVCSICTCDLNIVWVVVSECLSVWWRWVMATMVDSLPKEYNLNKPLKHVLQKSTSPYTQRIICILVHLYARMFLQNVMFTLVRRTYIYTSTS